MTDNLKLCFVSPPFAGHLHPQLDFADQLRSAGFANIHFFSTPEARRAVELFDFPMTALLEDCSFVVKDISDTEQRVGVNPFRLWRQLQKNLSLMHQLRSELKSHWLSDPPGVVIVDFAVPVAGLLASELGFRWWTTLPSICLLETGDGVPAYLGGLSPRDTLLGRARDAAGRMLTRAFKISVRGLLHHQMSKLGISRVYRSDGFESIYSPQLVLGMGLRQLEFPRKWPGWLRFVGPMTRGPKFPHQTPEFDANRPHIIVSLGTHVRWAKQSSSDLIRKVAERMPDVTFHFSLGDPESQCKEVCGNFHIYGYIPYDLYVHRYAASINHCGPGVMYSCIKAGIPILAWPQDFDQFDFAARVIHHGLGKRLRPEAQRIVEDLRSILNDAEMQTRIGCFRDLIFATNIMAEVGRDLEEAAASR